jgi:hypothetical protein
MGVFVLTFVPLRRDSLRGAETIAKLAAKHPIGTYVIATELKRELLHTLVLHYGAVVDDVRHYGVVKSIYRYGDKPVILAYRRET